MRNKDRNGGHTWRRHLNLVGEMNRQRWRESSGQWSQQSGGFAFSFLLIVLLFIYFIVHIHGLPYENSTYVCDNHGSWHFHPAIWFCCSEYDLPRTISAMFGGLCTFNWRTIEDYLPSWFPPASLPIHGFTEEKILLPEVSHPTWNSPPSSPLPLPSNL